MNKSIRQRLFPFLVIITLVSIGALTGRFVKTEVEASYANSLAEDAHELAEESKTLAEEVKKLAEENEDRADDLGSRLDRLIDVLRRSR